jgi:hypothetical protein
MPGTVEISQVGKREDLADWISIADRKDCPLLGMIPMGKKPTNMLMSWQADDYESPSTGGVADGEDATQFENAARKRAILQNYCQQWRRTAKVGNIAEDVSNVAGAKAGEMARSLEKKDEEIKRDIEATLGSDNEAQLEESSEKPYKTRGIGKWLQATAQSVLPVNSTYLTPSASIDTTAMASLTEALFKGVLTSIYTEYGKAMDLDLVCGTALKTTVTGFTQTSSGSTNTQTSTFNQDLASHTIISNVKFYEGDFNNVRLHTSLLLANGTSNAPTRRGYVLSPEFIELRWNTKPIVEKLPNLGGGPRAQIRAIAGLVYKNPKVGGKFAATS